MAEGLHRRCGGSRVSRKCGSEEPTLHNIEDDEIRNYHPESYRGKMSTFSVLASPLTSLLVPLWLQGLPTGIWVAEMVTTLGIVIL
ncbi:unnamed protein product [Lathyrus oleraceus]